MQCELKIQNSVIDIGVETPFSILHITDAHIDMTANSEAIEAKAYFEKAMEYAKKNNLPIVCTGDNFKWLSDENYSYAMDKFGSENDIFIPGNHDFCAFPDSARMGEPEKQKMYLEKWAPCYKQNIYFDSKIINGVNFVSLMNIYYRISAGQIRMLRDEVKRGYPIILCMHIPLFSTEKADEMILSHGNPCVCMLAPPEKYCARYGEKHAAIQRADRETLDAVEFIANEPQIKAVIAGHLHEDFDGFADCGKRQIVTKMVGGEGIVRLIKIV